ncbi:hypothetical protein [Paenibacillus sp. FSL R7-0333]|uniref:hypothetical protein n=1 Tax=Paenibacillus sp. FSL R7-0333 TaxID=1926587 RepID=UPI00267F19E9
MLPSGPGPYLPADALHVYHASFQIIGDSFNSSIAVLGSPFKKAAYARNHWDQYMNIPGGIHVYDMACYQGKLYAALGASGGPLIYVSADRGNSWTRFGTVSQYGIMRAYTLFGLGDTLYASSATDHQSIPQGLFSAGAGFQNTRKELLPNSSVMPIDILDRGETVYVLGYAKEASGQYTNYVYRKSTSAFTSGGGDWSEVFRFIRDAFARSFEESGGDFYFGLGSDADVIPASTGTILKLSAGTY